MADVCPGTGSIKGGGMNTDLGMSASRKGFYMVPKVSPSELGRERACPAEGVKCVMASRGDTATCVT